MVCAGIFVIILALTISVNAGANTIIVPDDYPTIQQAVNAVDPYDTVYVRSGTYHEHVTIGKPLTLQGEDKNTTIINISNSIVRNCKVFGNGWDTSSAARFGIDIAWCNNSSIVDCDVYSNDVHHAIILNVTTNCTIEGCHVWDNTLDGIRADGYQGQNNNNTIRDNVVERNNCGIQIGSYNWPASNNLIYHNYVIDNSVQAGIWGNTNNLWDNGYPSGGNYWSDLPYKDLKSGPNQDQPGSDGINDAPYLINSTSKDRYPLVKNCPQPDMLAIEYRYGAPKPGWSLKPPFFTSWMQVRIENLGDGDAFNVSAKISDVPAYVQVIDGNVSLGDISAGSSAWSGDTFKIKVDMSKPQPPDDMIYWDVEYDDSCGNHHTIEDVPQFPAK